MSHSFKNRKSLKSTAQIFFLFVLWGCIPSLAIGNGGDGKVGGASSPGWSSFPSLTLTLIWYDTYQLLPRSFETMTKEVNRIFEESGVVVHWEMGRMDETDEDAAQDPLKLNVILHPNRATAWGLKEGVMGAATHREGMKGSAYIFFPAVVGAMGLGFQADALEGPRTTYELARALGRVVAHEVVHVLVPYHPHASEGVMKPRMHQQFLARRDVHIDPESVKVIREEIQARAGTIAVASREENRGQSGPSTSRASTRSGALLPDRSGWLETPVRSWRQPLQRRAASIPQHR